MSRNGRNLFKRRLVRLRAWFTLGNAGITPRLVVAFASVAALAAAANLIIENGVAIIEQQRHVEKERSELDSQAIHTLRESVSHARRVVTSAELSRVLSLYERATHEHAETETRSTATRYASARAALDQTLRRFESENPQPSAQNLSTLVDAHKKSADALIHYTRERRNLLGNYANLLTRMESRVKDSIDHAWKANGRTAARQPLLDVRAQLVELRAAFAGSGILQTDDASTASIARGEWALSQTLRQHAETLRRSEGAAWFKGMNDDITALISDRAGLIRTESRRLNALERFARESSKLLEALPVNLEAAPEPVAAVTKPAVENPVASGGVEKPSGSLVAWLSAIVLVVLFYICFVTILSVVRPVRRLIAATQRLARGENARVKPSGGIRELESLGEAFNSMADQLAIARASAREAQQRLEAKVEERTRQLQILAEQDPLTGIANRRQLFIALNAALDSARISGERVGLFFLDIDNFKTLNDSLGHTYGDRVLVAISRRLQAIASTGGFAARLGGDEFTLVHRASASAEETLAFGAAIVRAFETPLDVDGREVIVSVSVGASVFPDHDRSAEALLRAADVALFHAKALGRSRLATFTPELLATASAKFTTEQKLRRAIQNDEFELFYQPLVDSQSGDIALVEALLRWRQPDGSYRAPDEFLAVAEETGLIVEISDWVLRTAIRAAAGWHRGAWPGARVAINVSPRQFLDFRFVARVEELLKEHALPAGCIELELTESVLQTGAQTIKTLDQLRTIGVPVALDDFGTGYSSLVSLQQLPLSRVKLDRSLIAGIDDSARSAAIVRATIALCRGLGLEVTAEGVERAEQFAVLMPHRPITLQGFLFSRAVPAGELPALLAGMPAKCAELLAASPNLPPQSANTGKTDKRRALLSLVRD
jgi:diguanylate cyclase (GGDEF)-like protein